MVNETFQGGLRNGRRSLVQTAVADVNYWSIEPNGIRFWGYTDFTAGVPSSTSVFSSGDVIPLSLKVGETVAISYTETKTPVSLPAQTIPHQQSLVFTGFETLILGGKTFVDTCRFDSASQPTFQVSWVAKDFGLIKFVDKDANGVVVSDDFLSAITAQP